MTIRGNLRSAMEASYPGTNVLGTTDFQASLGIIPPTATSEENPRKECGNDTQSPKLLLIGHNVLDDLRKLHAEGVRLDHCHTLAGVVDTYVLYDTSLSKLMAYYSLANMVWMEPARKEAKQVFDGAHNAGNDAVATLKVALALALDDEEIDVECLVDVDTKVILLAYDCEHVESGNYIRSRTNRTTELGFASLHLRDIIGVPPGVNGVNWHLYIKARHWINEEWQVYEKGEWKLYVNKNYCVGDPKDFRFGTSEYYSPKNNPYIIHAYLEELADPDVERELTEVVEKMENFSVKEEEFPTLVGNGPTKVVEKMGTWSSKVTTRVAPTGTMTLSSTNSSSSSFARSIGPSEVRAHRPNSPIKTNGTPRGSATAQNPWCPVTTPDKTAAPSLKKPLAHKYRHPRNDSSDSSAPSTPPTSLASPTSLAVSPKNESTKPTPQPTAPPPNTWATIASKGNQKGNIAFQTWVAQVSAPATKKVSANGSISQSHTNTKGRANGPGRGQSYAEKIGNGVRVLRPDGRRK